MLMELRASLTWLRSLRDVDDPTKFVQLIEYEAREDFEPTRQKMAGDARMQPFLQMWRTMFPGGIEIDVYQAV
jgi:hypothetical protein